MTIREWAGAATRLIRPACVPSIERMEGNPVGSIESARDERVGNQLCDAAIDFNDEFDAEEAADLADSWGD